MTHLTRPQASSRTDGPAPLARGDSQEHQNPRSHSVDYELPEKSRIQLLAKLAAGAILDVGCHDVQNPAWPRLWAST
jgi:hypothetical protein